MSIEVGWGRGVVVCDNAPDVINGRLYQLIEAMGMPQKQEESLKGLVQKEVWDVFKDAINITSERHSEIREAYYKKLKETGNQEPMTAI